jgi:hypothetical protein
MKYKIIKKTLKTLIEKGDDKHIEIQYFEWYEARRKGRIFGFWHKVGHKYNWDELVEYTTKTIEEMEDYIRKYHEVKYSKYPIKIIKEVNL